MKHIQKAALVLASAGFAKAFVAPRINTATFCSAIAMSASSFYVSGYNACNPCLFLLYLTSLLTATCVTLLPTLAN